MVAAEMGELTRQRPQTHQEAAAPWCQTNKINVMKSNRPGLEDLLTGDRSWTTP